MTIANVSSLIFHQYGLDDFCGAEIPGWQPADTDSPQLLLSHSFSQRHPHLATSNFFKYPRTRVLPVVPPLAVTEAKTTRHSQPKESNFCKIASSLPR